MTQEINLLKELASGIPIPTEINAEDTLGKREIERSDAFLASSGIKDKKLKFRAWLNEVKDWQFTPNNTEYYWDTYTSIYPSPDGKKAVLKDVKNRLNALGDDISRESYVKDNVRNWPEWLTKEVEPWFMNKQSAGADKNLFRARLVNRETTHIDLANIQGELDHEVSSETHIDDYMKAKSHGYDGTISIEEGRFTIPLEGKMIPAFTLEKANNTLTEEFISINDDRPQIKRRVDELQYRAVNEASKLERIAVEESYNKLGTYAIPEEFQDDVILDYVTQENFNEDILWDSLDTIMQQKLEEGAFHRTGDASRYFKKRFTQITEKLHRRIS